VVEGQEVVDAPRKLSLVDLRDLPIVSKDELVPCFAVFEMWAWLQNRYATSAMQCLVPIYFSLIL
jgi:hypothetical protein